MISPVGSFSLELFQNTLKLSSGTLHWTIRIAIFYLVLDDLHYFRINSFSEILLNA